MSICKDKARNKWYIAYNYVAPDGSTKKVNIKNAVWDCSLMSEKDMKKIELNEILKNKSYRDSQFKSKNYITVKELCKKFTDDCYVKLSSQTAYGKELILKDYVLDFFDNKGTLDKTFTTIAMDIYKKKVLSKDISQARMNKVLTITRELLDYACKHEYMSYEISNRCQNVLENIKVSEYKEKDIECWSPAQWDRFIATFTSKEDFKWKVLFEVAYFGALRIGELVCLKVEDFNQSDNTIHIYKSADNFGHIATTKNQASIGYVSIPQYIANDILAYLSNEKLSNEQFIFFGDKMVQKGSIRDKMAKHIDLAGVPYISVHGLRHSCASRLLDNGADSMETAYHLRHKNSNVTMSTYAHLFENKKKEIVNLLK